MYLEGFFQNNENNSSATSVFLFSLSLVKFKMYIVHAKIYHHVKALLKALLF